MPQTRSTARPALSRRGFLAGLGALAGLGTLAPLAPLLARGRGKGTHRLEASRPLFGTWVRIVARDGDRARAARGLEDAFTALHRVDATMSIHRPDSQVSRVNAAAGRHAVSVDAAVLDVVARACAAAERTAGVYDPTVLPLMRAFGFYAPGGAAAPEYPGARALDAARARVDWAQVRIDAAAGTLGLARAGAGLDLGSIGKGWGVDVAVAALRARGVRHGLVDVGGNVYGLGVPDDEADGWSVGVFHPVNGTLERIFVLRDAAVATSGNREQTRVLGGVRVGHLLDARRGAPADSPLSASVVAATGTDSDTMSTVAFLLGPDRLRAFTEARDAHFVA